MIDFLCRWGESRFEIFTRFSAANLSLKFCFFSK